MPTKKTTTKKSAKKSTSKPRSWDSIGADIGKKIDEECKKEGKSVNCKPKFHHVCRDGGIYGLGFIGALIYYISTATSFWMGALGIIKAIFWPGFLVYALLKLLGA